MEGDGLKKKKKRPRQKRPKVGPQNLLREDTIRLSDVFSFPILNDAFLKDIGISKATREKFAKTGGMDKSKRWDFMKDKIPKGQRTTMEEQSGFPAPPSAPPRGRSPSPPRGRSPSPPRRSSYRPASPSRSRAPSPQRRSPSPKRPEFKKFDPLDLQLDTIFKGLKVKRYATLRELNFNDRQAGVLLGMTKKGTIAPTTDAIERRLGKKILGQLRLLVDFPDEVVPQGSSKKHLFKDLNISVPKPHESAKMEEDARLRLEAKRKERMDEKALSPAKAVAPSAPVDLPSAPVQPPKPRTFAKKPLAIRPIKLEDVEDFSPPPRPPKPSKTFAKKPLAIRPLQLEDVDDTPRPPPRLTSSQLAEAKLKPTTTNPPAFIPSPPEAKFLQGKKEKLKQVPLPLPSSLPKPRRTFVKKPVAPRPIQLEKVDVEPRTFAKKPLVPRPIQLEDVDDTPRPRKSVPFVDPVLAQLRAKSVEPTRPRASSAPVRRPPAPLKRSVLVDSSLPDDPLQLAMAVEKVINKDLSPSQQLTDAQDLFAILAKEEVRQPTPTKRPPAPKRRDLTPAEVRPEPPPSRRPSPKPSRPKLRQSSPNLGRPFQQAPSLPTEDKTFRQPRSLSPELKPIKEGRPRGRPPNVPNTTQNRLAQQLAELKGVERLPMVKEDPPAPTPTRPTPATVMDFLVPASPRRIPSVESVEETMSTNAPSPKALSQMSLKELNAEFVKRGWSTRGYGNSKLTRLQALDGTVPYKGDVEPPKRLKGRVPTPVKTRSRSKESVLAEPAPVVPVAPSPARGRPPRPPPRKPPERKPNVVLTSVGRIVDPLDEEEEVFSVSDSESGASESESGSDDEVDDVKQHLQELSRRARESRQSKDETDYTFISPEQLEVVNSVEREKMKARLLTERWREEQSRKRQEQEEAQDRVNELKFRQFGRSMDDVSVKPKKTQEERDASRREREDRQARLIRESRELEAELNVDLAKPVPKKLVKAPPKERPLIERDPQAFWSQLRAYKKNFDAEDNPFNKGAIEYDIIQFARTANNPVLDKILEGVEKNKKGSWDALWFYTRRQDKRYKEETTKELETGKVVDEKTGKSYRSVGAIAYATILGLAPSWLTKKTPPPKATLPSGDKVSLNPEDDGLADLDLAEAKAIRQLSLDVVGQQKRRVIPSDKSPNRELLSSKERQLQDEIGQRWFDKGESFDTLESSQSPDLFDLLATSPTSPPRSAERFEREDVEGVGLKGEVHIDINSHNNESSSDEEMEGEGLPCWKGYVQRGMKMKNGKKVPNCIPRKFGGDLMMNEEGDFSEDGYETGSDDGEEIVYTKSHHRIMAHPAMMSSVHFRHPNAQSNVNALSGGLLRDDLQEGYNKVVPKSLRPAVSELGRDTARYVGRQMKPKAQKVYNKVVPKSLRPAVSELGKDAGNYVKRRLGFGLGAGLGYGMEDMKGCGVKKYAKDALKTYVPASMRKSVKELAKEGAKEFYKHSGAESAVHEAKGHYGRAKKEYEQAVPKEIRRSVADLGKATYKEARKMSGMGSDPLHPTEIPHGTGMKMKKGSPEMKEHMARLRAMRKKKMSGGQLDAEPPRSRSYTTNPAMTGGEMPPRSRMP